MAELTLSGVSDDGATLVLRDDEGQEHTLTVGDALRAAIQPSPPPDATPEKKMDSTLRPRDIQARVRAGESPETVAEAAGLPVDRIMIYAEPVLAEREHVAGRAQRSSVRRSTGDSPHRTLGDAVAATLRRANIPGDRVTWDAWRRQDGRWTLTGAYAAAERTGNATFTFDGPGNFVVAENDDARWLIDDLPPEQPAPAPSGLSVVREPAQLGDDALHLAAPAEEPASGRDALPDTADLSETAARIRQAEAPARSERVEQRDSEQALLDELFEEEGPRVDGASAADPDESAVAHPEPADEPAPRKRRKGRASVPSWDEIMFGGGDQKHD